MKISLESKSYLADDDFDILVTDALPETTYEIEMTLVGYYNINVPMTLDPGIPWTAKGTYQTDRSGRLSINKSESFGGSYKGIEAMALFYLCRPQTVAKKALVDKIEDIPLKKDFTIWIEVHHNSKIVGRARFKRYFQLPIVKEKTINLTKAKGRLFYLEDKQDQPAIIVLSGSDGRIEKAQNIAQLLASRGFVTLALSYFGLRGLPKNLNRIEILSVQEAATYLKALPQVNSNRIGLYGRSKGAEMALVSAAYFKDFSCLVLNSPSCAVMEGIKGKRNSKSSSWLLSGEELPYTPFSWKNFLKGLWYRRPIITYRSDSLIPLKDFKANLLMIAGGQDEIWPASASVQQIEQTLWYEESQPAGQVQTLILPDSAHMLTIANQPNHRYSRMPWKISKRDSQLSWQATVAFFKNYL